MVPTVRRITTAGGWLLGAAAVALAAPAWADGSMKDKPKEEPKRELQLSANVAVTSEYVFRGISQTAENAAVQGGFDLTWKWFYVGVWASNLDFGGDINLGTGVVEDVANIEIDWYAGIKHTIGKFEFDLGVIYYSYPDAFDHFPAALAAVGTQRELDYFEVKFSVKSKWFDVVTLTSTYFYSPEYTNETGEVWTTENAAEITLPKFAIFSPTVSGLLGYQTGDDLRYRGANGDGFLGVANGKDHYWYWNVGLTLGFHEKYSLDLRYWDTNIKDDNPEHPSGVATTKFCTGAIFQCDERFVATLKATW